MADPLPSARRVLEPIERVSEVLFGLIMVLTFTGTLSVAEAGRPEVRTMLLGALGCNLAWGLIDGVFYLMGCMAERGRNLRALHAVRATAEAEQAQRHLASALPPLIASILKPEELETMRRRLSALPQPPDLARLRAADFLGASGVFLLVFLSTFPVTIPFTFMSDISLSLRISNAVAIAMLFGAGYAFGRITGHRPVRMGVSMVVLGAVLVSVTIALGG